MQDLTSKIKDAGNNKREEEKQKREEKEKEFEKLLNTISANTAEYDMWIKNWNVAVEEGLVEYKQFSENDFYADGIKHKLGFLKESPHSSRAVGVGAIGGGYNGNVSLVYYCGELFYDEEKYYDYSQDFMKEHPINELSDGKLQNYINLARTIVEDTEEFEQQLNNKFNEILR